MSIMNQPCKLTVMAPNDEPSELFEHLSNTRPDSSNSDYQYLLNLGPNLEFGPQGEVSIESAENILDAVKDIRYQSAASDPLIEKLVNQKGYYSERHGRNPLSVRDIKGKENSLALADLMGGYLPSTKTLSKLIQVNNDQDAIEAIKAYARGEITGPPKLVNTLQQLHDKALRAVKRKFAGEVIEDDINVLMKLSEFRAAAGYTNTVGQPQDPKNYVGFMNGLNGLSTGFRRSSDDKFFTKMRAISKESERAWKRYINTIGTDVLSKEALEGMSLGATTAALYSHDKNIDLYLPDRQGTVSQIKIAKSKDAYSNYIELTAYDYPKLARLNTPNKRGTFIASAFLRQAAMQGGDVALLPLEFLDPVIEMLGSTGSEVMVRNGKEVIAVRLDNRFKIPPYDLGWKYKGSYIDPVFHQLASELPRKQAELIYATIKQPGFKRKHGDWELYQKLKDGKNLTQKDVEGIETYEEGELEQRVERFYQDGGTINVPAVMELLSDPTASNKPQIPIDLSNVEWTNKFVTRVAMEEVLNRLQSLTPGLTINLENDPSLPYAGKFDGSIYVNLANADLETPFHEFGHAWLAALKLQDPEYYEEVLNHAKTLKEYENKETENLTDDERAEEIIADLIGRYGRKEADSPWLTKLMKRIARWWEQATGMAINYRSATLADVFEYAALDVGQSAIMTEGLSSKMLETVVDAVMFKRVPPKLILDEKQTLLELVAGDLVAQRRNLANKRADRLLQKEFNKDKFIESHQVIFKSQKDYEKWKKDKDDKTTYWQAFDDVADRNALKAKLAELILSNEQEKIDESMKMLESHFQKSYESRHNEIYADIPRAKALKKLFPDYRNFLNDENLNSKIVRYKKEELDSVGLGHLYTPELDTGDIMLAIHKSKEGTKYNTWIDIAIISPDHVSNKNSKVSMYDTTLLGRPAGIGKHGLKATNTPYHQGSFKAGVLALHLANNGQNIHRMTVTKISKDFPGTEDDRTVLVPAGNVLPELRDLLSSEAMVAIAKQSDLAGKPFLKNLAFNDKFEFDEEKFKPEKYYRSYIRQLIDRYDDARIEEGMDGVNYSNVANAAETYLFTQTENDLHTLIGAAEYRLQELRSLKLDNENNEEFLLVAGLLQELQSPIHRGYNKIADLDFIDKYTTAVNGITDPYLAWWIRQWKTSKMNLANELQPAIAQNAEAYKKVKDDYYKHSPVEGSAEVLYAAEERVFRPLIKRRKMEIDGQEIEINMHRLLNRSDEEWDNLRDAQKEYIEFFKERIKITFLKWHIMRYGANAVYEARERGDIADNEEQIMADAAMAAYESSVFFEGYLPPMKASAEEMRNRAVDGNPITAYADSLNRWWDLQSGDVRYVDADRDLNDLPTYLLERGLSKTSYFEYLGLNEEGDPLEDAAVFESKQREISDNLVDMVNRFQLQQLQHKNMRHLLTAWKAARALIANSSDEVNVIATTGSKVPANLEYLDALVQKVLFGKEISLGDSPRARKVTAALATAASATSIVFLGFNFVSNIANFTSVFTNLAAQQLAEEPKEERPTKEQAKNTALTFLKEYQKDPVKMYAIGRRAGVIHFDPYDTINSRRLTGKPKSAIDMKNLYVVDQMGDETMRLFHMYYHMKKDGVWESWVWDSETESLTYDATKDKRDKAIKEKVSENIRQEIYRDAEAVNDYSPYDVNLILRLERKLSRKLGGYKEGDQTLMGMYTIGRAATQFRRYMMMHVENAAKERSVNPNSVSYRADGNGNAVLAADIEEGHFTTLRKIGARLRDIEHLSLPELKKVLNDPLEVENITKMMLYVFVSALATMGYLAFAAEDDEKVNWWMGKSNKWDGFWTKMYHAVQGEMNMLNMLKSKALVFTNPLTFTALITLASKLTDDLTNGDYEKFGDDIARKVGAVKIIAETSAE